MAPLCGVNKTIEVNRMSKVVGITKQTKIPGKTISELYYGLLYLVEGKYKDETRHETAKRLIIEAQTTEEQTTEEDCNNG